MGVPQKVSQIPLKPSVLDRGTQQGTILRLASPEATAEFVTLVGAVLYPPSSQKENEILLRLYSLQQT